MGVYSNLEILHAITQSHIVCHPFMEENVRGSSIDLTLGEHYYTCDDRLVGTPGIYNPFDEEDVHRYFVGPFKARPWGELPEFFRAKQAEALGVAVSKIDLKGIPEDHPLIVVGPRARILAHTHEFVGIHPPGTTEMRARSSWGRNGIAVCLCAGWGDPGYINRWTMEIHNHNDEAVPLPVGERIAQLIFHTTGHVFGHYGDGGSKYQGAEDLAAVISAWTPQAMLPRCYKDERKLPLPVVSNPDPALTVEELERVRP